MTVYGTVFFFISFIIVCACLFALLMPDISVQVAGGVLFVAGLLLKLETGLLNSDIVKLWNKIRYNGVYLGTIADLATLWMIIFGGLMMVIAIVGWVGTWKKFKACLITVCLAPVRILEVHVGSFSNDGNSVQILFCPFLCSI